MFGVLFYIQQYIYVQFGYCSFVQDFDFQVMFGYVFNFFGIGFWIEDVGWQVGYFMCQVYIGCYCVLVVLGCVGSGNVISCDGYFCQGWFFVVCQFGVIFVKMISGYVGIQVCVICIFGVSDIIQVQGD